METLLSISRAKILVCMIYQTALLWFALLAPANALACSALESMVGNWSGDKGLLTVGKAGHRYDLEKIILSIEKSGDGLYRISACEGTGIDAKWLCHSGLFFSEHDLLYATDEARGKKVKIGACGDSAIAMRADNSRGGWSYAPLSDLAWEIKISASSLDLGFSLKRENLPYQIKATVYR